MSGLSIKINGKRFGDKEILGEIGISIPDGQRVALLGPSGVGKSTLLAMISGADADYDGKIERSHGRLAMIFQNPRLLPWRTLVQNIALIPDGGGEQRARNLLAQVGLTDAADQHPEKVSLGMQRRAALARAMAIEPALLLMDEPLVSLDPDSTKAMRLLLRDAMDQTAATAVLATHSRLEALALADRVLELGDAPARVVRDRQTPLQRSNRTETAVAKLAGEWFDE